MPGGSSRSKVRILGPDEWDEKQWGMSYEEFHRGMRSYADDRLWFYKEIGTLRKDYLNKWVAVRDKRVIASDDDHDRLVARLESRKERLGDTQILYVHPRDTIVIY